MFGYGGGEGGVETGVLANIFNVSVVNAKSFDGVELRSFAQKYISANLVGTLGSNEAISA